MSDRKKAKSLPRREFLKTAGLTAGAAGIATAALSGATSKAEAATEKGKKSGSYQETEHVRTYYELARS